MIQHFVLIWALFSNGGSANDYTTGGQVYFENFDLCRNAQMRLEKEFSPSGFTGPNAKVVSICVPTEEKHK